MSTIGNLNMDILIKVGKGDPVSVGSLSVPLKTTLKDNTLQIELSEALEPVRVALEAAFNPSDAASSVTTSGAGLIAIERRRQIDVEGYDADNDRAAFNNELALAAAMYALPEAQREYRHGVPTLFPWISAHWKRGQLPPNRRSSMSTPHLTELLDMTAVVEHVTRLAVTTGLEQSGIESPEERVAEAMAAMSVADRQQLRTDCLRVAYPVARVIAEQGYARALADVYELGELALCDDHVNPFSEGRVLV